MPATVSGIIDTIRLRVNHTSLTDAEVLSHINNTQRLYQRKYPVIWQEKIATSTVTVSTGALQTFTLPTDLKMPLQAYAIVSGEYQPITYKGDFFSLVTEYAGATSGKQPVWWSQFGGTGYFFPVLSSALDLAFFYSALLPDFTVIASSNNILVFAPEVLEYGGIAEYYDTTGEIDKATRFRAIAAEAIRDILKQHEAQEDAARNPVPKTPGTIYRGG